MDAQANGIGLTKREINALIAFSSDDSDDRNKYGVFFRIRGDRVFARATNGRQSVEADGISNEEHHDGEWMVDRKFLTKAAKLVSGNGKLRLPFEGASLRRAVGPDDSYERDEDAAIAQAEFPDLAEILKRPSGRKLTAHLSLGDADIIKALVAVSKAADRALTLRVPPSADVPTILEAENEEMNTKWTVSIAPYAMPAKKGGKGRGKGKDDRQQDLPGAEAAE